MKRIIVNADDLGADEGRNAGIFEAMKAGVVTSVSILPNGPALEDALSRLAGLNWGSFSLGIHLNLSEGKPIAQGLKLVTGPDGCFLGKKAAQRLMQRRGDSELEAEIAAELEAQIAVLQASGIHLDHLDGHQHVHIFPAVLKMSVEKARAHRIPWIRVPEEFADELKPGLPDPSVREEARFFSGHAERARPFLNESGIFTTDHFRGLYLKGRLPASLWIEFMEAVPDGLTEFMVHPGRTANNSVPGPFSAFSNHDREMELKALIDGSFEAALMEKSVELTKFPEAPV